MEERIKKIINEIQLFIQYKLKYKSEDLPYYLSIIVSAILFIAGVNIFLEIAEDLAENDLNKFDDFFSNIIVSFRSDPLTSIFIFITDLGDSWAYILLTLFLAIFFLLRKNNWRFVLQITTVSILAFVINNLLKDFYGRERPSDEHLVTVSHLSFPSGHAMSAAAFYGFIVYLCLRYIKNPWIKYSLTIICVILIFLIGISRVYLGVHYPSDVMAGFIGGFFWVTFCIIIFNILGLIRKKKAPKN